MILENTIEYKFNTANQATRWNKKHNTHYNKGDSVITNIFNVSTTAKYRRIKVLCKCDVCGREYKKRICDLVDSELLICSHCSISISQKIRFKLKPVSDETRKKLSLASKGEKNGFYGKTHTKAHCEKRRLLMLGNKLHLGYKNTKELIQHIRDAINLGFANGSRARTHGNALKGQYKNFLYLSSYELNFLKYIEKNNLLHKIDRGPTIEYIGTDNKIHHYLSDYYMKDLNLVIEIKSDHYWKLDLDTNILKMNAAKLLYKYILVMNNDFSELDLYLLMLK